MYNTCELQCWGRGNNIASLLLLLHLYNNFATLSVLLSVQTCFSAKITHFPVSNFNCKHRFRIPRARPRFYLTCCNHPPILKPEDESILHITSSRHNAMSKGQNWILFHLFRFTRPYRRQDNKISSEYIQNISNLISVH